MFRLILIAFAIVAVTVGLVQSTFWMIVCFIMAAVYLFVAFADLVDWAAVFKGISEFFLEID